MGNDRSSEILQEALRFKPADSLCLRQAKSAGFVGTCSSKFLHIASKETDRQKETNKNTASGVI